MIFNIEINIRNGNKSVYPLLYYGLFLILCIFSVFCAFLTLQRSEANNYIGISKLKQIIINFTKALLRNLIYCIYNITNIDTSIKLRKL